MPNPIFVTHIFLNILPSTGMWSILGATHLKEIGSSSPKSYELPTTLQLRVELHIHLCSPCQDLVQLEAEQVLCKLSRCCEFLCTTALCCLEDSKLEVMDNHNETTKVFKTQQDSFTVANFYYNTHRSCFISDNESCVLIYSTLLLQRYRINI